MLSKHMTSSLMILITIFAFAVPAAMAQFEIKLSVGSDEDVSFADGNQVVYGEATTINIMSTKVVNPGDTDDGTLASEATSGIEALDFTVIAYNKFGGTVATGAPTLRGVVVDGTADGMHFMAGLGADGTGVAATSGITRVLLVLKKDSVELADPRAERADDGTRKAAGKNKEASLELHFVATDEGPATDVDGADGRAAPAAGVPIVYSIERAGSKLRPVTADTFEVLITLADDAAPDSTKDSGGQLLYKLIGSCQCGGRCRCHW